VPMPPPPGVPVPMPPPPATPAPPVHDDTISILAFICTKLPKTPDPLPQLIWK
jgi:hypothetical protein